MRREALRCGALAIVAWSLGGCGGPPGRPGAPAPAAARESGGVPAVSPPPHAAARGALPPIPRVQGPLRLDVVYPVEGATLTTRGDNFIFGSTGTGAASLRINGRAVPVAPNGAFLAFIPVPADGVYQLEAAAGAARADLTRRVQLPRSPATEAIDTASIRPRGALTVQEGERIAVRFRGQPGGSARLVLPDGTIIPLIEQGVLERSTGFGQDRDPARRGSEYRGEWEAEGALRGPGAAPVLAQPPGSAAAARIEVMREGRVASAPLPVSLGVLPAGGARWATVASERPDGLVFAAAVPGGGAPTAWPLINGTRVRVTGERDGALRVQLTPELSVWADAAAFRLEPGLAGGPETSVDAVRVLPSAEWVDVRLGTPDRPPFRVTLEGPDLLVEVYGARSRSNWLYYGSEDPLVRRLAWEQPQDGVYRLRVSLARPAWGWRAFWDERGALVVRIRRPPRIQPERPLQGIHVAVDAGHPPLGATGPTRLTEADANLAIARRLAVLLRAAGAQVTETRPDQAPVALVQRPVIAERAGAHIFVSVHNNAFPDGVDPFANHGTSVFYNAPQSLGLARALQRDLLQELGLPDLGIALADLAVVRPAWMPSALTEAMFMMIPEQEAALRDPQVQERIARAHLRGIEAFLREHAAP